MDLKLRVSLSFSEMQKLVEELSKDDLQTLKICVDIEYAKRALFIAPFEHKYNPLLREEMQLVDKGQKIEALKMYRLRNLDRGCGIVDAKNAIEAYTGKSI